MAVGLVIEDFEYENDNSLYRAYWANAPGTNSLHLSLVRRPVAVLGERALAMTYRICEDPPSDYVGIESKERVPTDWQGYASLCLWVQNQDYQGDLVIQFRERSGETWKYHVSLRNVESRDVCAPLTEDVLVLAEHSPGRNELVDLGAIDNIAFYLGQGGRAEGVVYLDGVNLRR